MKVNHGYSNTLQLDLILKHNYVYKELESLYLP